MFSLVSVSVSFMEYRSVYLSTLIWSKTSKYPCTCFLGGPLVKKFMLNFKSHDAESELMTVSVLCLKTTNIGLFHCRRAREALE